MDSISLIGKSAACVGCEACAQICPKKCISMENDSEGFIRPRIDIAECLNCGMCRKVCPIVNKPAFNGFETKAYAAYSTNEGERLASSSGGLFSLIAAAVLAEGGTVFGAAFDDSFAVNHVNVESKTDISMLRGSKYVQSRMDGTYRRVLNELKSGRRVLFSGTICQIAGLKAYLQKEYANLLCVDVLCHGVPSPKVLHRYIEHLEERHRAKITHLEFRNKKHGWKSYCVTAEFSNGTKYESAFHNDTYMKLFLENICLRPSCYACAFNEVDRVSDITLGDCWGVENVLPEMDDNNGTSVVLVHTETGMEAMRSIDGKCVLKQANLDMILPPTSGGRMSVKPHRNRKAFFRQLNCGKNMNQLEKLLRTPWYAAAGAVIKRAYRGVVKILRKLTGGEDNQEFGT